MTDPRTKYSGNTITSDDHSTPKKIVEKLDIQGTPKVKKLSLGEKFSSTFFSEDKGSVLEYIVWDVLVPGAKNTISEMISTGIDRLLFGGSSRSPRFNRHQGVSAPRTNYRSYGSGNSINQRVNPDANPKQYEEIILDSRADAETVLERLLDIIDEYQVAAIGDLYELVGYSTKNPYTQNYGWFSLGDARIERVKGGYLIKLPTPRSLK